MKINSIRIENFRSFDDATIDLHNYSCFVGANGAGKSNVLAALNPLPALRPSEYPVVRGAD